MKYSDFRSTMTRGEGSGMEYLIPELGPDYWVSCRSLGKVLTSAGLTKEEYYNKYVDSKKCDHPDCDALVEFRSMYYDRTDYCSSSCQVSSQFLDEEFKKDRSNKMKAQWEDESFRSKVSESARIQMSDPVVRKDRYIKQCSSLGIEVSQVYVGITRDNLVKYGVGDGYHRLETQNLDRVFLSSPISVHTAADIEYMISIKVPLKDSTYEVHQCFEHREVSQVEDILAVITSYGVKDV